MTKKKETVKTGELEKVVDTLFNRTTEWGRTVGLYPKGEKPGKGKYSDKAIKYNKIIGDRFGCYDLAVRELVEEITGEKLPRKDKDDSTALFKYGVVLVPTSDPKGHDYEIGKPILIKDDRGTAINMDGSQSDKKLPAVMSTIKTCLRLATRIEIEELLLSLQKVDDFGVLLSAFFLSKLGGKN